MKEKTVSKKKKKKKNEVRNSFIWRRRNRSPPQAIDWFQCVIRQKKTTENPQCPVNWKRHYSCMYWIPYFWTILNFISWDGNIELSSWLQGKCFNMEMEFSFYIIKSFAMWQKSRRNAFIRTKPDRTMKRRIPVIHSIKRTRSRMRLLARKRSRH